MGLKSGQRGLLIAAIFIAIFLLVAVISTVEASSSLNPSYNISGKWEMIGNQVYHFNLDIKQNGGLIKGTITRTNGVEPVDAIDGKIYPDTRVEFDRIRPNQWAQKYTGKVSASSDGTLVMSGTFTHAGTPGEYSWNATLTQTKTSGPSIDNPPIRVTKPPLTGVWGQKERIRVPLLILPNTTLPGQASKNETSSPIQTQTPGMTGKANLAASSSIHDWRDNRRIAVSNLLGINQTANLDFAEGSGSYIDSEGNDLTAEFKWWPTITAPALAPASAVWQVSTMPFPDDPINWANPPGLLAQGNLRADEREFTLDFSQFTPKESEVAHYWAASMPHLLFQKKVLTSLKSAASAKLARTDPSNSRAIQACNDLIAQTDRVIKQIDASPVMSTANSKMISRASNLSVNANALAAGRTILRTKSISPSEKISLHRDVLGMAQTGGVTGSAGTQGISLNSGIINPKLSLSRASLLYTLPQTRRTYYIRAVPLDVKGNCTGMPSNQKEVIVGKPIIEVEDDSKNMVKLAVTFTPYKPHWSVDMCDGYYVEEDVSMDWNQDLNRWFIWKSDLTNLTDAQWQISQVPFDNEDPMNPAGLVARGKLNLDPADLTKEGSCAGKAVHEFCIDFSKFAPAPDPNNPLKIKYYVRVIAMTSLNAPGKFAGYISPTRIVIYGQPDQKPIEVSERVPVTVVQPDVKMLSYSPIHDRQGGAEYHYIATKDFPETDIGLIKQGSFWHKGDPVDLTPEEKSWWDEFVDFVESIVDFFAGIINWVSEAWDALKNACINAIASSVCLGNSDCTGALAPIVSAGLDTGLMAMGIPPEIPNFDQLANMGEEYLVKTIAAEVGVSPELADLVTPEDIKKGVDVFVQESGSGGSAGLIPDPNWQYRPAYMTVQISNSQSEPTLPGTLDISDSNMVFKPKLGSVPIPSLQPGESLTIPIFFERVPGTIITSSSTVFYENCYYNADGSPQRGPNGEICDDEWLKLYGKPDKFSVTAHCDPGIDIQALEEQLGKRYVGTQGILFEGAAETFYIQYLYEGNNHEEVDITPNQSWSA